MQHLVISDQRVTSMTTAECGEALVSIQGIDPKLVVDDSAANVTGLGYVPEFLTRKSVAEKLKAAAQALPDRLHLLVKETLRPTSFQEFVFSRRLGKLATEHPEPHQEELVALTARFVAPPWIAGHPNCLSGQGFVNYPFEWWHWSYGDKYWAAVTKSPVALYGAIG